MAFYAGTWFEVDTTKRESGTVFGAPAALMPAQTSDDY